MFLSNFLKWAKTKCKASEGAVSEADVVAVRVLRAALISRWKSLAIMFLSVNAALSLLSDNVEPIYHFYVLYFYAAVPRYYLCHKQTNQKKKRKKKQEKHKTEKTLWSEPRVGVTGPNALRLNCFFMIILINKRGFFPKNDDTDRVSGSAVTEARLVHTLTDH